MTNTELKTYRRQLLALQNRLNTDVSYLTDEALGKPGDEARVNLSHVPIHMAGPVAGEEYPSDIINAWKRALRVATVRFERAGQALDPDALWAARRVIIAQAEGEAEQVLQNSRDILNRLADQLLGGPMDGSAVRLCLCQ